MYQETSGCGIIARVFKSTLLIAARVSVTSIDLADMALVLKGQPRKNSQVVMKEVPIVFVLRMSLVPLPFRVSVSIIEAETSLPSNKNRDKGIKNWILCHFSKNPFYKERKRMRGLWLMAQYKIHKVPLVPTYQLWRPFYHWNLQNQLYGSWILLLKWYFGD